MTQGVFIVLEGLDGTGKSTQAARLCQRLRDMGHGVVHTREPGGTALGERVRAILLDKAAGELAPMAEVFLYQASRAQLVEEVIRPAVEAGKVVVCERWHFATEAYQVAYDGMGPRVDARAVRQSSSLAVRGMEPQRAVYLELPEEVAARRLGRELDRVESRGAAYRQRVARRYREIFARDPVRLRVVSAAGSPEEVHERLWEQLHDLF